MSFIKANMKDNSIINLATVIDHSSLNASLDGLLRGRAHTLLMMTEVVDYCFIEEADEK